MGMAIIRTIVMGMEMAMAMALFIRIFVFVLQFSRNIHRKKAEAFAMDSRAVQIVRGGIESNLDTLIHPMERPFIYMPLMHSENIEDLKFCVKLFEKAVESADNELFRDRLDASVKFAKDHMKIVEKYGRYPHRNAVLGRQSTEEELEYLKNAETYGQ